MPIKTSVVLGVIPVGTAIIREYVEPKQAAAGTGGPYIEYTPENVANRTYPLTGDAYFSVNREPARPLNPKLREFMRIVLSRERSLGEPWS